MRVLYVVYGCVMRKTASQAISTNNMSDLEDDLLALAGGDSGGSENEMLDIPLKRARGLRQLNMQSADELDDDDDDNDAYDGVEDQDDGSDDGYNSEELVNPYPLEGKYKDEADREALLEMDEIEREQTLFERSQEMDRFNEKQYLQQRMKQQRSLGTEKKTRSSSRKTGTVSSKLNKLNELRKQREQNRRKRDEYEDEDAEEDDQNDEQMQEDDYDEDDYENYEDSSAVAWGSGKSKFKARSFERATFSDINKIRVGRSFLSKYLYHRNFLDTISKTFGKINVGVDRKTRQPVYRAVQIEEAVHHPNKQYWVGEGKTDVYLVVSQNRTQKKEFPVNVFSDGDITPDEFERYVAELAKTNEDVAYRDDVNEKAEQLHSLMNSGFSNKDIDEMVSKKQKLQKGIYAYDAVYQKSRVMDELKVARQDNDTEKVKELLEKLKQLEKVLYKDNERTLQSSATSMSKVNERNRKLNQINIRNAEVKSLMLRKTADLADGDPFSRLKTTTRIFYQDLVNEENQKALQDARDNYESMIAEKSDKEAKIASSTYRVLGNLDLLIALVSNDYVPVL